MSCGCFESLSLALKLDPLGFGFKPPTFDFGSHNSELAGNVLFDAMPNCLVLITHEAKKLVATGHEVLGVLACPLASLDFGGIRVLFTPPLEERLGPRNIVAGRVEQQFLDPSKQRVLVAERRGEVYGKQRPLNELVILPLWHKRRPSTAAAAAFGGWRLLPVFAGELLVDCPPEPVPVQARSFDVSNH